MSSAGNTVCEGLARGLVGRAAGRVEAESEDGSVAADLQDIARGQDPLVGLLAVDPYRPLGLGLQLIGLTTLHQTGVVRGHRGLVGDVYFHFWSRADAESLAAESLCRSPSRTRQVDDDRNWRLIRGADGHLDVRCSPSISEGNTARL